MIIKQITFFGEPCSLACDARCDKSFGINGRPKKSLSENPDDYEYLSDDEIGVAPVDPGTYEGECAKPINESERLNKWCARECERSVIVSKKDGIITLKDFSKRIGNIPVADQS